MNLNELFKNQLDSKPANWKVPVVLVAIDPGATTGYSIWTNATHLSVADTIKVDSQTGWDPIIDMIENVKPSVVILEDYRIYASKQKEHVMSRVDTIRIIGAIEYACSKLKIPLVKQMAHMAKGFVTDDKLKEWCLWKGINKHARDSIRHAIYFLLFNKSY